MSPAASQPSDELLELTVTAAAAAIRDGSITAQEYAAALLARSRAKADLNAFIFLDPDMVLEAAAQADRQRAAGKTLGPLHGVPIGIKDSMSTFDMPTSIGSSVLEGFLPDTDAPIVAAVRSAGAILFAKNNLVEMSYGLTGVNEHHGQAKNPYDQSRVSGGSSSGAGASVGGRLIPAALGGDTVGSIRVPASLCGTVGFRPTTGRWTGRGIAPISHTLDTAGPMARSVEDCALIDAIVTGRPVQVSSIRANSLEGVRLGFAAKQIFDLIDPDVEKTFREGIAKLKAAGAEVVEVDLGDDFASLAEKANWPIFFHETMPHLTNHLEEVGAPVTFRDVYEGLGSNLKGFWADFVLPQGDKYTSAATYRESLDVSRPALQKRYADAFASKGIEALLSPTVPLVAPPLDTVEDVVIAGQIVSYINLAKNAFPSSCAALPGITIPMGLSSGRLPMGLEMDGNPGDDVRLLEIAAQVSAVLGPIPPPPGL